MARKAAIKEVLEEYPYSVRDSDVLLRKVKVLRVDGTREKVWQHFDEETGEWRAGYKETGPSSARVKTGWEPELFWWEKLRDALETPGDGFLNVGGPIYIVDGEKDVMTAWREGRPGACSPHGMGHWTSEMAELFNGHEVVLVPDQDGGEGDKQAAKAEKLLRSAGASVTLRYPKAGAKDLTEHFASGGSWDSLGERKPGPDTSSSWVERAVRKVESGDGRNETGIWLACQLRDLGMSREDAEEPMRSYQEGVESYDTPPYEWIEAEESLRQAYSRKRRNPPGVRPRGESGTVHAAKDYDWNDYGNGRRLVDEYGSRLRYVAVWKENGWLIYDGMRWKVDSNTEVLALMTGIASSMWAELEGVAEDQRKAFFRHVNYSNGIGGRRAALTSAGWEREIAITPDGLDADPWLLNCRNGTLDLRTGELMGHEPGRLITKVAPVSYDPGAKAPTWRRFLGTAFPKEETRAWLARIVGYCLTGSVREKGYWQLLGETDTGKTVFIETISRLLGPDYAQQMKSSELMTRRVESGNNDGLADLKGKRFASISEPAMNSKLDVATIKHITGGGRVRASRKWEHAFEFRPEVKIVIDTNHELGIGDTDDSIWNRTNVVPFKVRIPKEEQDPDLADKLAAELDGILAWAVKGCLEWQRIGISPPAEALEAEAEYRADQDPLRDFLDDICELEPEAYVQGRELYHQYVEWCENNKVRYPLTVQSFGTALRSRGVVRVKRKLAGKAVWTWNGIGLRRG